MSVAEREFQGVIPPRPSSRFTGLESLLEPDEFAPVDVVEVELADGLFRLYEKVRTESSDRLLLTLVRLHTQPLGLVLLEAGGGNPEERWPQQVIGMLDGGIEAHLKEDFPPTGCPMTHEDLWKGGVFEATPCLAGRRDALEARPTASVVVATRERPERLVRCLESLLTLEYPEYEIVVVDNDPETDRTLHAVRDIAARSTRVRYVRENRRGLAAAHNRGLEYAAGTITAFTDDDVIVDRHWLAELVAPFVIDESVAGATGLILPAELETRAQVLLESHGHYGKGYAPRLFDLGHHRPKDSLFPFSVGRVGSGANMAFESVFLRSVGGFDAALGTGTTARGGDDLAALFRVLVSGRTLAYRPGAIVWHHHRRDLPAVRRQAYDYALGLGAYLASAVAHEPKSVTEMLRRIPAGLSFIRERQGQRRVVEPATRGDWVEYVGMFVGPFAYAASRARLALAGSAFARAAVGG